MAEVVEERETGDMKEVRRTRMRRKRLKAGFLLKDCN
jgi:hypothetical protein